MQTNWHKTKKRGRGAIYAGDDLEIIGVMGSYYPLAKNVQKERNPMGFQGQDICKTLKITFSTYILYQYLHYTIL